ncbi:MAG TPA: serine hydrolase [Cytophagaceae bacterium]|jgi:CubicO group peptidase (beta-lactamase class C family)
MKAILLVAFILLATLHSINAQLSPDSIEIMIRQEVVNKRSVGIAVGIVDSTGRKFYSYGKVRDNSPLKPDSNTLYEIGSITKVFTSLLLADMATKGELKLNDPISKHLPKTVKSPNQNGREITLLDLSAHRSGLPRNPDNWHDDTPYNPLDGYSLDSMYSFISKFKPTRQIGSKYEYSNYGVGLLGHILSLVARKGFDTLLRERILIPLEMNNTTMGIGSYDRLRLAQGHNVVQRPVPTSNFGATAPCGGLISSVKDLLTLLEANMGLRETTLKPAIDLMQLYYGDTDRADLMAGLAWVHGRDKELGILAHGGGTGGYSTFAVIDTVRKVGVVVLSNSTIGISDLALHILRPTHPFIPYQSNWTLYDSLSLGSYEVGTVCRLYNSLKAKKPKGFIFNEDQLNTLGYDYLWAGKIDYAIKIFKLNVKEYPNNWNVYDSLGEAYMKKGNKRKAIANYERSISMNPKNVYGMKMLQKLRN